MTDLMEIREVRELVTDIRQELQDRRQDRKELIQILYEIESCLMKLAEKEKKEG